MGAGSRSRTHVAGKGPGGRGGAGLRLSAARGAPECLWLQSADDQAPDPSRLPSARVVRGNTNHLSPILQTPHGPSWHGNPSSPPATPQGHWSHLASISSAPSIPPMSYLVAQGVPPNPFGVEVPHQHLLVGVNTFSQTNL